MHAFDIMTLCIRGGRAGCLGRWCYSPKGFEHAVYFKPNRESQCCIFQPNREYQHLIATGTLIQHSFHEGLGLVVRVWGVRFGPSGLRSRVCG